MGYREPFGLYPRKGKNGKVICYYRTYDEYGRRTSGKSTGQTSKAAAKQYVIELIKRGGLVTKKDPTFAKYAEDWWCWDRCLYIRGKLMRDTTVFQGYADTMRIYLEHHILPSFRHMKLQTVTPVLRS